MPTVSLDDHFDIHHKLQSASHAAYRLQVSGLCYCSRNLTDGYIDDAHVDQLAASVGGMGYVDELVGLKLWERVDGGYDIHDYLTYNPAAQQIRRERAQTAERKRRFRERRRVAKGAPAAPPPSPSPGVAAATPLRDTRARIAKLGVEVEEVEEIVATLQLPGTVNEHMAIARCVADYTAIQPVAVAEDFVVWQERELALKSEGKAYGHIYKDRITGWKDQMARRAREGRDKFLRPAQRSTAPLTPAPLNGYTPNGIEVWNDLRRWFISLNNAKHLPCRQRECWSFEHIEPVAFDGNILTITPTGTIHPNDYQQWPAIAEAVAREHLKQTIHVEWKDTHGSRERVHIAG